MLTKLPFSGFYESLHGHMIDQACEQMFQDDNGHDLPHIAALRHRHWQSCNYHQVFVKYAKAYALEFTEKFAVAVAFQSLESPREYNFDTDRIMVTISAKEVRRIHGATDAKALAEMVKDQCTSRSGFISFYDPDMATWGPVETWDSPQVALLLRTYAYQEADFDSWAEYYLMEDYSCNGYIDNWLNDATPAAGRLYKIHDYLMRRAERELATA